MSPACHGHVVGLAVHSAWPNGVAVAEGPRKHGRPWGHVTRDRDGRERECAESRFVAQGAARIDANCLTIIRTLRYPLSDPSASSSSGSHRHLLSLGPPHNYYTSSPS